MQDSLFFFFFFFFWQSTGFQSPPNFRGFSGFFWCFILILFSDALFARSSKRINVFKVDYYSWFNFMGWNPSKSLNQQGGLEKRVLPWKHNLITSLSVTFRTIRVLRFNGFWRKLIEIAPLIYSMLNWVEEITSSVSLFACFTIFLNLNISGTNEDIWKR